MRHIIIYILSLVLLFSCNQGKDNTSSEAALIDKEDILKVKIELKTSIKDEFIISLNEIEIDEFQRMYIQAREIIPVTSNYDYITVNFFENMFSKKLEIRLGDRHPKQVEIKSISISKGVNNIFIEREQIKEFFNGNKYVSFDDRMKITTKEVDGRHLPVIYANTRLINLLKSSSL
jgi:hypothetical protein